MDIDFKVISNNRGAVLSVSSEAFDQAARPVIMWAGDTLSIANPGEANPVLSVTFNDSRENILPNPRPEHLHYHLNTKLAYLFVVAVMLNIWQLFI